MEAPFDTTFLVRRHTQLLGGGSGSAGTELCPSAYRATGLHAIRLRLEACRRTIQETQSPPHRMFFARTLNTAPRDAASNPSRSRSTTPARPSLIGRGCCAVPNAASGILISW